MARLTREELQAQLAELDAEETVELRVKDERGRETTLTGAHAKKWLRQLGLEDDEAQDEAGDEEEEQDPKPKSGYFGRKG